MSTLAVAARPPSVALVRMPADLPAAPPTSLTQGRLWRDRLVFWPAECVSLLALIYMLPVVIYVVCLPIALAVNAVLFCAGRSWTSLWN